MTEHATSTSQIRLGISGLIEARSDTEGYDRMRECRCHYCFVSNSCSRLRSWTWREYFYPRFPNRNRIASNRYTRGLAGESAKQGAKGRIK